MCSVAVNELRCTRTAAKPIERRLNTASPLITRNSRSRSVHSVSAALRHTARGRARPALCLCIQHSPFASAAACVCFTMMRSYELDRETRTVENRCVASTSAKKWFVFRVRSATASVHSPFQPNESAAERVDVLRALRTVLMNGPSGCVEANESARERQRKWRDENKCAKPGH